MKFIFFIVVFLIYSIGFSQGVLNNGARIVFVGASQMYIDGTTGHYTSQSNGLITPSASSTISLEGNWINNSANVAFTVDNGGVVLAGATQTIGGTNASAFYNLSLAGNGIKTLAINQTTVGGQSTFTGILSVGSSTLDLNANQLDVTNSATGAITRTSGYIISETNTAVNPSVIRWYHRTSSGTRVYPFGVAGSYIPFTFNITTPMSNNASYIDVSTRATAAANNLPWAGASNLGGPVTHMYSPNGPYADGSDEVVIDRWWDITNSHPVTGDITFSYRGLENTLISPYDIGFIGPQYWDGSAWVSNNLIIGAGASVTSAPLVGSVSASNVSTFCPWVLSAKLSPLPVQLINFDATCVNNEIVLEWCTASENENINFIIQQSIDGINYTDVALVNGKGFSNEKNCYKQIVSSLGETNYFKLKLSDNKGTSTTSKVISVASCKNLSDNIIITNDGSDQIGVIVNAIGDKNLEINVHNSLGQIIKVENMHVVKGYNKLDLDLDKNSNGVYYVSIIESNEKVANKKVIVSDFTR